MKHSPLTNRSIKVTSRVETLIEPWRTHSGMPSLPADLSYITLSGQLYNRTTGDILPNCEVRQLTQAGLVQPRQIHLIENDPKKHEGNRQALEQACSSNNRPTYHAKDMVGAISDVMATNPPGIVNVDTQLCPRDGIELLTDVLYRLNTIPKSIPTMVSWNTVYKRQWDKKPRVAELEEIFRTPSHFTRAREQGGWTMVKSGWYAQGATHMYTCVFWRAAPPQVAAQ